MSNITKGSYGAMIRKQDDEFHVYFLYNNGEDVWDRKVYKSEKTAEKKVKAYFEMQGAA
jgi:uncharacterized protein YegP (UPF0339 family)